VTGGLVGARDLARAGAAAASLGALLALSPPVAPSARALLLLSAALGAAYVAPGVALKERPGLDVLSHALGYGILAFLLGAASAGALPGDVSLAWRRGLAAATPYAIGIAAVSILTMIADAPGDRASGQRTAATRLGAERSWRLAALLSWGTALTGLVAVEAVPALWGLAAGTWLALGPAPGDEPPPPGDSRATVAESLRANRLAIALQVLFVALLAARAPWVGVGVLVLGAAATAYNRATFGEGYPLTRLRRGGGTATGGAVG